MISRVGFVSRLDEAEALETAASLFRFALGKGLTAVPEEEFARLKHLDGGRSLSEMKVDLIVTVGGDGTVLKTSMLMSKPTTPILAVNMGRRGYLTEVPPGEAEEAINDCLKGRIRLEERMKLSLMHGSGITVDGLNEALVAPALPYKMIDVKIRFGELVKHDVATKGSTVWERAVVTMSWGEAKFLTSLLQETISRYEKANGDIKTIPDLKLP